MRRRGPVPLCHLSLGGEVGRRPGEGALGSARGWIPACAGMTKWNWHSLAPTHRHSGSRARCPWFEARLRLAPHHEVVEISSNLILRCDRREPRRLRAVPKAKSIRWIDLRREGRESCARMAVGSALPTCPHRKIRHSGMALMAFSPKIPPPEGFCRGAAGSKSSRMAGGKAAPLRWGGAL